VTYDLTFRVWNWFKSSYCWASFLFINFWSLASRSWRPFR